MPKCTLGGRGQLVSSLIPKCGSQELNLGHQTWQQVPLPTEAPHQSLIVSSIPLW